MTTTALMPLDPSVSPQQAARVLTIRADLLPPEIRDGRRARRARSFVLVSLVLVLTALGSWYTVAAGAKNDAVEEYNQTLDQLAKVQRDQKEDAEVQRMIEVKQGNTLLEKELKTLLGKDMSWANLIDLIRDKGADASVEVNEINGGLPADDAGQAGTDADLGTLQVTGTADSKKEVAEYVNALGKLDYLSNPFVNSVTEEKEPKVVKFVLTVTITDKGLCGRFTTDCESRGK
jgi:Tfp pilus assembly protein PilN